MVDKRRLRKAWLKGRVKELVETSKSMHGCSFPPTIARREQRDEVLGDILDVLISKASKETMEGLTDKFLEIVNLTKYIEADMENDRLWEKEMHRT